MKRWLLSSLSSRLLAVFLITAIAAVILMTSLFSRGLGSQWQRTIVPHLVQYVSYLTDDIGMPPDESRTRELATRLSINIQVHGLDNVTPIFHTDLNPIPIEKIRFVKPRRWHARSTGQEHGMLAARIDNIAIGEDRNTPVLRLKFDDYLVYMEFARPRSRERGGNEMLMAVIGLAILLGICFLAIRHLLKPIGSLQSTVQRISNGDLSARTQATGHDDLALLAQSVDKMSERIAQMLDAKRELLLAISHELRSPLTRSRVACELLEPSRHKQKLINDIDEMERLISQLVESERLQNHVVLDLQTQDLKQIINDTVAGFDNSIDWHPPPDPYMIIGDGTRLQVLVRNLLDNALQHGKPVLSSEDGNVQIQLCAEDDQVKIVVTDNGPGIDDIHLPSITEAFYRPDASRTRKTGGIGLGLHLCKRIAEAHGGTISIESVRRNGIGVRVVASLPKISDQSTDPNHS